MESHVSDDGLTSKLLIAMPGMGDPRFEKTVILMCAHSEDGAMGLIINKPAHDLEFSELLSQLDIEVEQTSDDTRIYFGGPVEHGRGFVLHSPEYNTREATLDVGDDFAMTATLDILEDMAKGEGPNRAILALGYAGWGPGQLEGEIMRNGWLTCDASQQLVFDIPNNQKWAAAIESLGIHIHALSGDAGRA